MVDTNINKTTKTDTSNTQAKARADAAARGRAELQAQQQREAAQRAAVAAGKVGNTGAGFGGGNVSFDSAGNRYVGGKTDPKSGLYIPGSGGTLTTFGSQSSYSQYLAERGLSNKGTVVNAELFANANFSDLAGFQTAQGVASTISSSKPTAGQYGYTSDVKVTPAVMSAFAPQPENVNYNLEKTKPATQARSSFAYQFSKESKGGIITPQSKDKSFGWGVIAKDQFTRNSSKESQIKESEAFKAGKIYPSFSNTSYFSGGTKEPAYNAVITLGKAQKVFGNKSSFGWGDIAPSQFTRGSAKEAQVKQQQAVNAGVIYPSGTKEGYGATDLVSVTSKPTKTGKEISIPLTESLGLAGGVGGTTKFTGNNVPAGTSLLSDKDFRNMLATESKQGAEFYFFSGNQEVGKTSGARAYHDYLGFQSKYPDLVVQTFYPQTEQSIISNVKSNPDFFAKEPSSYWQSLGKAGFLSSKGMKEVNLILYKNWQNETAPLRAQDKTFRQSLTDITNAGLSFSIKNKEGQTVATTQGPRAYHDYLAAQKKFGKDVTIQPNYEWTFGQYGSAFVTPTGKEQGNKEVIENPLGSLVSIAKGAGSVVKTGIAGEYALVLSTLQYAQQKPDKSFNLGFGVKIPYNEQARQNLVGAATFGLDIGKLTEGKIASNENVKLTPEGQKIVNANKEPSFLAVNLGLEKPTRTSSFYAGQQAASILGIAFSVYGVKDLIPIGVKPIGTFTDIAGKAVTNRFLVVGSEQVGYKGLIGKTTSGMKLGGPTYARVRPQGSSIYIENPQRGLEIATPNRFASDFLSSKGYWEQVGKIGKASRPIESDLVQYAKTMNKVLASPETNIQRSTVLETNREGLSEATVKGGLTGIGEKQSPINFFNPRTGRAGKIQGSTSTEQFLPADILQQAKQVAPAHDIDVIKSNPLGILEETQAQGLAKSVNLSIQKEQGIAPSLGIVYRGMPKEKLNKLIAGQITLPQTSTTSEIYTSPEASTALFFGQYNNPNAAVGLARISLTSESDILKYKNIPKSELPSNPIGNWRKGNPIMIEYAKGQGAKGLRKPVKTGGEETILFGGELVAGVSKVSPNIKLTTVLGRRIYEGKEKAIEFVTRKEEAGSSLGKSGSVYGIPIDTSTFTSTVKGTGQKVKHTSGLFQAQTNIAKNAIQNVESAKAQTPTKEQLAIIGKGEYFAPELFAGKAIIRPYYQTLATSRELLKNPETRAQGFEGIKAAHATRYYQFDNPKTALFKWEEKPATTVDEFLREQKAASSTLVPTSKFSAVRTSKAITSLFSGYRGSSRPARGSALSGYSETPSSTPGSRSSKTSGKSSSGYPLSSITKSSSLISGKLGSSRFSGSGSTKSGLLGSGKSGSGKSGSGKSGSGKSGKTSSITPFSGTSGSGFSGSGFSGSRLINTTTTTQFTILPKPKYFNDKYRRSYKTRERPTGLINLNVKNPFSSSLNINVSKGKRFSF